jgi:hypothetical protein
MANKTLLFEFDPTGTEGINISYPNEWNNINNNVSVLTNIKFSDDIDKKNKLDVKSIPSPFARMILFRNAFEDEHFPVEMKKDILEDILDAMEFIFLFKTTYFEYKLKFVKINLSEFKSANLNSVHKKYIKTLNDLAETYYKDEDDPESKRYNTMDVFFIDSGNDNYDTIIAGTSPFTGFFTPEKINTPIAGFFEHEKDRLGISRRKRKSFAERNIYFLKYLQGFYKVLPASAKYFKKELEHLFRTSDVNLDKVRIPALTNEIKENAASDVKKIEIIPGLFYDIFDEPLEINSYYKLRPSLIPGTTVEERDLPLVLVSNNTSYEYYEGNNFPDNWDLVLHTAVTADPERKYLPGSIKKYPWIVPVFDFFEEKLIKLPHPQDSINMFAGQNEERNNFQYLIPLTEKYFKYFKPEDIENYLSYRIISCSDKNINSDQVEFLLRIPVDGINGNPDVITVKKIFSGDMINYFSFEQDTKTRSITKKGLYSALWPAIMNNPDNPQIDRYYLLQYEDLNPLDSMWKNPKFYNYRKTNGKEQLQEIKNTKNHTNDILVTDRNESTRIYSIMHPPELIQMVRPTGEKGFFLPRFDKTYINIQASTKEMLVGIDFGTSNTVIAFKREENDINLLPIDERNFKKFYGNKLEESGEKEFERTINMFFVPMKYGVETNGGSLAGKPFSTEVCYLDSREALTIPVLHSNITFKREIPSDINNEIKTNLKWSANDLRNKELIKLFFNELKAIVEKQSIEKGIPVSKIRYRYSFPLSYDEDQKQNLTAVFKSFNEFGSPLDESQCAAKYFTYSEGKGFSISNPTPAITIDIGGGTSDIVGYMRNDTMFKSSVIYGGQDIFNDIIKNNSINNPFVVSLRNYLLNLAQKDNELNFVYDRRIFDKYKDSHSLFSYIVSKEEFKKAYLDIHNTEFYKYFRLTILYFYSAIIYYAALNIKKYFADKGENINEISEIRIGIGGNGSKLLEWICRGERWDSYTKKNPLYMNFFKNIFSDALGMNETGKENFVLTIIQSSRPKEEVVRGLLIQDRDAEKISSMALNSLFTGEKLAADSKSIGVFDDYEVITRSNYSKIRFENYEESEINKFNGIFAGTFDKYDKEMSNDFNKIYITRFINILKTINKDKLAAEVNLIISSYFAAKDEHIQNYNNSYFITEIKACLELIKKKLEEDEYLGNKI